MAFSIDKENVEKQLIILSPPKSFESMIEKVGPATMAPTMVCSKFQDSLRLEFGYVTVGSTNKKTISLVNPNKAESISIAVDRVSGKHGVSVVLDGASDGVLVIPAGGTASGTVFWIPLADMAIREIITFKMNEKAPLQVIVYGTAGIGANPAQKKDHASDRRKSSDIKINPSSRPSRTILLKEASTTTTAMTGTTVLGHSEAKEITMEAKLESWINNKLNVSNGIGFGSSKTELQCHRKIVSELFASESSNLSLCAVRRQIDDAVLCIRTDRPWYADLGLQQHLQDLLFSYDPYCLRLAMEAVTGQIISMTNSNLHTLKTFIVQNFASIKSATTHSLLHLSVVNPTAEHKAIEVLNKNLLKRFIEVVYLMDAIKTRSDSSFARKLILFRRDSLHKSSDEIMTSFCKTFLSSEGDILHHLSAIGYKLKHKQQFIDEIECHVENLFTDLRDGVLLARLLEELSDHAVNITQYLRVPAVSRLQKIHNVGVVMSAIDSVTQSRSPPESKKKLNGTGKGCKSSDKTCSSLVKDIVDGSKEQTQWLLWHIMYLFDLELCVDLPALRMETQRLQGTDAWTDRSGHAVRDALLNWCSAVCRKHDISVGNFGSDMDDGAVLCYLVSHYFPSSLPSSSISQATKPPATLGGRVSLRSQGKASIAATPVTTVNHAEKNMQLLKRACKDIGQIPVNIPSLESKASSANETKLIVFVGYFFCRVQTQLKKDAAKTVIQRYLKNHLNVLIKRLLVSRRPGAKSWFKDTRRVNKSRRVSSAVAEDLPVVVTVNLSKAIAASRIQSVWKRYHSACTKAISLPVVLLDNIDNYDINSTVEHLEPIQESLQCADNTSSLECPVSKPASPITENCGSCSPVITPNTRFKIELNKQIEEVVRNTSLQNDIRLANLQSQFEATICQERDARERMAMLMQAESMARQAAEARLEQLELEKRLQEEARIKALEEKRLFAVRQQITARVLQRYCRAYLLRNAQLRKTRSAILCQRWLRGSIYRRRYWQMRLAVTILQAAFRRKQCARVLARLTASCIMAQKLYRGLVGRRTVSIILASRANDIRLKQAAAKEALEHEHHKCMSRKMQKWIRNRLFVIQIARKAAESKSKKQASEIALLRRLKMIANFTKICLFLKSTIGKRVLKRAASKIIRFVRASRLLLRARIVSRGFKRLQACFRGHMARARRASNLLAIATRLKSLNLCAATRPEAKIGRRTVQAVSLLHGGLNSRSAEEMIIACNFLKFSTGLSKNCCDRFSGANGGNALFAIIRSCNRSDSHQHLLICCLDVLLQVSKHTSAAIGVAEATDSIDTMIDLLQLFRDKKSVFCLACELLCRLVHASNYAKRMCNRGEYRKRLQGILDILERKARLDSRIKSVTNKKLGEASMIATGGQQMELSFICNAYASTDKSDATEAALKMMRCLMNLLQ